jgi:hypothetical protein
MSLSAYPLSKAVNCRQQDALDRFKPASPQFAAMRKLAMNFRAIVLGADPAGPHHILRAQLIPIEGLSVH